MAVRRLLAAAALVALAHAAPAAGEDPGRWRQTGRSAVPLHYLQGMASDPDGRLWFAGLYLGLYRTDARLRERARREVAIPPAVTSAAGFNHIGDPAWDARRGGRLLLPLECYSPGAPGGANTCRRGAIGVADPVTLAWRFHVQLDPAEIAKAMWAAVSPDGTLMWTSSGADLLAYRTADVAPGRAASGAPPLRAVRRLSDVLPFAGVSGGAFYGDRLLVAGRGPAGFEVHSIELASGRRRLEIQRPALAEPEGLDVVEALGGVLHWVLRPASGTANLLVHYAPIAPRPRLRLGVRPAAVPAGRRVRLRFRARAGGRPVAGAVVRIAGRRTRTDAAGNAAIAVRLRGPARRWVVASRPDLRPARIALRVRRAGQVRPSTRLWLRESHGRPVAPAR
jgi:hypothetical protein